MKDVTFGAKWLNIINREKDVFHINKTWKKTIFLSDANVIFSRWVFDVKYTKNGGINKFKTRLVARGFSQRYNIDYQDTFAPIMRIDSLRVLLIIITVKDLECHQININNTFTESMNTEIIYISLLNEVRIIKERVLKILKSLYGLK
jgi:hypothetical protein